MLTLKKTDFDKCILFAIALGIYCNSYCYLTWETYDVSFIRSFVKYFAWFSKMLLVVYGLLKHSKVGRINKYALSTVLLGVLFVFHYEYLGYQYSSGITLGDVTLIISIITLLGLPNKSRALLMKYSIRIFAIVVFPSLLYFILEGIGVSVPSSYLQCGNNDLKVQYQMYYSHYPFGLIMRQYGHISRYTGIFDEAGFVGTLCALFIPLTRREKNKFWTILLLIEAIFSLSMGCYLLLIVYGLTRAYQRGFIKFFRIALILLVAFVIFINVDFHNESIAAIQQRIDFSSAFLVRDNRTTDAFDVEYKKFISDGGYGLMMGYGGMGAYNNNPNLAGASSWKCLIYDYGIIGTLICLAFFISIVCFFKLKKDNIAFLIVYFVSIYQRPYVFTYLFIFIFINALSYIGESEKIENVSISERKRLVSP